MASIVTRGAVASALKGPNLRGRRPHATTSWPWFIAYLAFVIYGSLVPLNYNGMALDEALRLFALPAAVERRAASAEAHARRCRAGGGREPVAVAAHRR